MCEYFYSPEQWPLSQAFVACVFESDIGDSQQIILEIEFDLFHSEPSDRIGCPRSFEVVNVRAIQACHQRAVRGKAVLQQLIQIYLLEDVDLCTGLSLQSLNIASIHFNNPMLVLWWRIGSRHPAIGLQSNCSLPWERSPVVSKQLRRKQQGELNVLFTSQLYNHQS